jgi:hypothetical protein
MTASLSFTLPEDRYEFDAAVQGEQWRNTLSELDQELRSRIKYEENKNNLCLNTMSFLRERISEIMAANNLSFD